VTTTTADPDYSNAFRGDWQKQGLILIPTGVTAEDRFGDVIRERQRAQRRWDAACEKVADADGRVDVFELADALGPRWWQ